MTAFPWSGNILAACAFALLCSGCFFEERKFEPTASGSGHRQTNGAPTISGSPPTSLVVGQPYNFQPSARDSDGDALTFNIQNRPIWATFDPSTGRLSGTAGAADVGQFTGVRIAVSDGRAQASLNAFSIAVNQVAFGSVTLSWSPPDTNADGSTITDLAGYRIYFGTSSGALNQMVVINNSGTIRWVVDNLSSATWYFSMTSVNASGSESARSTVVSRTVT